MYVKRLFSSVYKVSEGFYQKINLLTKSLENVVFVVLVLSHIGNKREVGVERRLYIKVMGLYVEKLKGSDGYLCHAQPEFERVSAVWKSRHMADVISGNTHRVGSLGRPSNFIIYKFCFVIVERSV